jgi:hypothetical protein
MKHIHKLLSLNQIIAPDTLISLPVAKDHGYYPGILYPYLQDKQERQWEYGAKYNVRQGIRWIPKLTAADIVDELPVFPDTVTVDRAAHTLRCAGLILAETTGRFLELDHVTGRKRDIKTWWHVSREYVALKNVPLEYWDKSKRQVFSALEAAAYGISSALILAHFRCSDPVVQEEDGVYKRLSATELDKVLPMDERTARRHLKELLEKQILVAHPVKAKLYRLK